jgi:hypothetical protein
MDGLKINLFLKAKEKASKIKLDIKLDQEKFNVYRGTDFLMSIFSVSELFCYICGFYDAEENHE